MKWLWPILFLFLVGCRASNEEYVPPPLEMPPKFHLGDKVAPVGGDSFGVVVSQSQRDGSWRYELLFQDSQKLWYKEDNVFLVERINWTQEFDKPAVQAEITEKELQEGLP